MSESEKWSYSSDEEEFCGACASREDAIAEAIAEEIVEPGCEFLIGRNRRPVASVGLRPDDVIELVSTRLDDDGRPECGEDWPSIPKRGTPYYDAMRAIIDRFEDEVAACIETHDPPAWWSVEQIEKCVMPTKDGAK